MIITEDTRQKIGKHDIKKKWWEENGDTVIRCKLPVGDYSLPPKLAIDTKQNISEIAANMCGNASEKKRFREECKLAKEIGCKLIFLIEDNRYKKVDDLFDKSIWLMAGRSIPGSQLAKAMITMSERYGVEFMFCDPKNTAEIITNILEEERSGNSE